MLPDFLRENPGYASVSVEVVERVLLRRLGVNAMLNYYYYYIAGQNSQKVHYCHIYSLKQHMSTCLG